MHYSDYGYSYSAPSTGTAFAGALIVLLLVYVLIFAFAVVSYVLQSLGFYTIAKRRNIRNPWLAWVPVGNVWIIGILSDQYQYLAKGRVRNYRKLLLGLSIAMCGIGIVYSALTVGVVFAAASYGTISGMVVPAMLLAVAIYALAILAVVFQYIALYDIFRSCDPGNAVLFLVLSIVLSVTLPFFVFACRNKDFGMPRRRPVQQVIPPEQLQFP